MSENDRDTAKLGGLIRDSLDGNQPESDPSLRANILEHFNHSPPPLRRKPRTIYWWAGGLAALAASVLAIQSVIGFMTSRTAMDVNLNSGANLVYEIDEKTTKKLGTLKAETVVASAQNPKPHFRTEVRTRQVPATTMATETKIRSVPVLKTRTETRTRQVTVDGKTQSVEYQINVPHTEQTAQNYTAQAPHVTLRTETYTVQVPVNEAALRESNKALKKQKIGVQKALSGTAASRRASRLTITEARLAEAEQKAFGELTNEGATPYFKGSRITRGKRLARGGVPQLRSEAAGADQWRVRFESPNLNESIVGGFAIESKNTTPSSGEQYDVIQENVFVATDGHNALSTFSIDVDTASYSNARRFLTNGQRPPPGAVRIEEFLNYFSYDYPQPKDGEPFSVNMEVAACPWNQQNKLLRIGLKGKEIAQDDRPASNLVFLMDVSGSMRSADKLPLMKQGLKMMLRQLREDDFVSIVTYAGNAGVALEPTSGDQYQRIADVIDSLGAGGSTNGSAGIDRAYEMAVENFVKDGTNRVILATDGDLNVGITDDAALTNLIASKAGEGVFLTVLGFGTGNLKDSKMEKLADNGNGNYAYIDSVREAHKVLVQQMSGSLVTIAKDVKLQLEFNPNLVKSYRQIGYENRALAAKDFDDDKKDAGEIGAGHTVTALYELVTAAAPMKAQQAPAEPQKLKYQEATGEGDEAGEAPLKLSKAADSDELVTVALRYKKPDADKSKGLEYVCPDSDASFAKASNEFQFASSVAAFAMLLRNSKHVGDATLESCEEIASGCLGDDKHGYRSEFLDLVRKSKSLK